ncbi:related to Epsin-5 [Saccharomycodes ludwigii]|uniref:Related to Epsin-5 n=1 Tax=Saccharomycodes ludwigii TaxID=36035 RepID=A0A376BAK1_9ASCO|nr:hypothetical protein SCDLUD_001778 [Saccharomycodes ludwigii]KAH3901990.1 hypothetical protein SCDLUD_001778 [Saccharomycodes ludwigii]SSD61657.1 related to Epsin-5 [Saccharomycodes ludwigii]
MDGISKKLSNLGIHDIRNAARFAQNMIVQYEPYQIDIRRATNTDAWGPTPKHLSKIMRNKFQVPMYLITEYVLKRLIDHMATRSKNLYEKARKQYVNYGNEWRVVLKCLIVIEYLLLNTDTKQEVDQVKNCCLTHKHILSREVMNYKIDFSNDGKMEIHERGIKKKCETIIQYLEDPQFLKKERIKTKKNAVKVLQGGSLSSSSPSYDPDQVYGSYDDSDEEYTDARNVGNTNGHKLHDDDVVDDDDDEFGQYQNNNSAKTSGTSNSIPRRNGSIVDKQRKQRREILKQQIKQSEQRRKQQQQQQNNNIPANNNSEPLVDLLDFGGEETPATPTTNTSLTHEKNVWANNNSDDDDDDFGDFQGENTTGYTSNNTIDIFGTSNTTASSGSATKDNDLLSLDALSGNTNNITTSINNNTTSKKDDLFDDLFSYSKSHV